MRVLEFKVDRQQLKKKPKCDFSNIIAGSVGYLQCKFHFDKDWKDCKKAVSFSVPDISLRQRIEYAVLLDENDCCIIPEAVCKETLFYIQVTGAKDKGTYKIVTDEFTMRQEVK